MTEATARKITPAAVLALIGMALASTVFLGALFIGMSIDPRIDMTGRLTAYVIGLCGLTVLLACRWSLGTDRRDRLLFAGATLASLVLTIAYAGIMLLPRL